MAQAPQNSQTQGFKVTTGPVSKQDALRYADELERAIGEIGANKRKPSALPLEPVCRLIQFARDIANT